MWIFLLTLFFTIDRFSRTVLISKYLIRWYYDDNIGPLSFTDFQNIGELIGNPPEEILWFAFSKSKTENKLSS